MKNRQKKRGRPRKDFPKIDRGTKELQQKRNRLLENGQVRQDYLAETLLGVFYAHNIISKPLYETGRFFGELGYQYETSLGHKFRQRVSVLCPQWGRSLKDSSQFAIK